MNRIEASILALQNYKPEQGVYLRVVGKGTSQRLEAVKMNWFGRLLMWCGCSNASMKKLANFVYQNISELTAKAQSGNQVEHLGKLIDRVKKYARNHPSKIGSQIHHIETTFAQYKPLLLQSQNPQSRADVPPTVKTKVLTAEECVDCFKAARGHMTALKVVNPNQEEIKRAQQEALEVRKLVADAANDKIVFKALIEAMSPKDVENYFSAVSSRSPNIFEVEDVFGMKGNPRFSPSATFDLAVAFMSVDQLMGCIRKVNKDIDPNLFYTLMSLIAQRPQADKDILFGELVRRPVYKEFLQASIVWKFPKKDTQFLVDSCLAKYYLSNVLTDAALNEEERNKLLEDFIQTVHLYSGKVACNSPLQDKDFFQQLSEADLLDIAQAIMVTVSGGQELVDSVLIRDFILPNDILAARLFKEIASLPIVKRQEFHNALLTHKPGCDLAFFKDQLSKLSAPKPATSSSILINYLTDVSKNYQLSSIEDDAFISSISIHVLSKFGKIFFQVGSLTDWEKFKIFKQKFCLPNVAVKFFSTIPNELARHILLYYWKYMAKNQPLTKAVEKVLGRVELHNWRQFQIERFKDSSTYKALSVADQKIALDAYVATL